MERSERDSDRAHAMYSKLDSCDLAWIEVFVAPMNTGCWGFFQRCLVVGRGSHFGDSARGYGGLHLSVIEKEKEGKRKVQNLLVD